MKKERKKTQQLQGSKWRKYEHDLTYNLFRTLHWKKFRETISQSTVRKMENRKIVTNCILSNSVRRKIPKKQPSSHDISVSSGGVHRSVILQYGWYVKNITKPTNKSRKWPRGVPNRSAEVHVFTPGLQACTAADLWPEKFNETERFL